MDLAKAIISLSEIVSILQILQTQVAMLQPQSVALWTQAMLTMTLTPAPQEPKIPQLDKYASSRGKFHGFLN